MKNKKDPSFSHFMVNKVSNSMSNLTKSLKTLAKLINENIDIFQMFERITKELLENNSIQVVNDVL